MTKSVANSLQIGMASSTPADPTLMKGSKDSIANSLVVVLHAVAYVLEKTKIFLIS